MMLAGAEIVTDKVEDVPLTQPQQGPSGTQSTALEVAQAPTREPVDIHFSNITCTVNLGFNKGEFLLFIKQFII